MATIGSQQGSGVFDEEQHHGTFGVSITTADDTYTIDAADITRLYFIEDIYSFSIVGRLEFFDRRGLIEFGPMSGSERIDVYWGENDKTKKFYVYKVNRTSQIGPTQQSGGHYIDLFFVDEYFHKFHSKSHSLSFKDKKFSDIVKSICKEHIGIEEYETFEESAERSPYFYTGLKTPAENLKWLIKRSSGSVSGAPGYLLYHSTQEKEWNFRTLEHLLAESTSELMGPEGFKYIYVFEGSENYINKILGYEVKKVDQSSLKNLLGGKKLGYDSMRKKFLVQKFSYEDALAKFTLLGKKSLFQKDLVYQEVRQDLEAEASEEHLDNLWYDNWIKQYCMQQTVSIMVRGSDERYAGGQIEIEWPSNNEEETYNKMMMGRYLVKSITHNFTPGTSPFYTQKMVLIKNAYQDADDDNLVSALKKNMGKGGF